MRTWSRLVLLAGGMLLALVVALAVVGPRAGAEETSPTEPAAEAWYSSGVGTVAGALHPAGTLHVGMTGGAESDRTYLRFELGSVPDDAEVDGIEITISVAADAGTQAPETAEILRRSADGDVHRRRRAVVHGRAADDVGEHR